MPSAFGDLLIVWRKNGIKTKVYRIYLPREGRPQSATMEKTYGGLKHASCLEITNLGKQIQLFLKGVDVYFHLDNVALEVCSAFQQKVLIAEHQIPRGWVSTYGRIARYLEIPSGARAISNALAHNPFPIIIPCHRAITSQGKLGGFQGGLEMKRALLKQEGIGFSLSGKVITNKIYY